MMSTRQIIEQSHRTATQFLIADLNVAQTFLDVAEVTESSDSQKRNRQHARVAYETVQRLIPRVCVPEENRPELEFKLAQLKDRLLRLGCILDVDSPSER